MQITHRNVIIRLLRLEKKGLGLGVMMFNAIINTISVISWRSVLLVEKTINLLQVTDKLLSNNVFYHIFCCNMFVFACSIIARSQCWLFALFANIRIYPYWPSNIRIGPQISIFAPEFNFWYLRSGLKENMSKYKERW